MGEALARLGDARFSAWIDEGEAADITFCAGIRAAHVSLSEIEGLDFAIREGPRVPAKLFIADMDSTMIGQECIDELADYAGLKAEVAAITERAMHGELDFASALKERVALLKGLEISALAECRRERIRPNPGAKSLIATMKKRGALTVLVSGGFVDFVRPIAEELGFDCVEANCLEGEGGKLTGRTLGRIVDAAAKRGVAEQILSERNWTRETLVAVGDGANDIPMVELAALGVGYRPKPAMAKIADGLIRHHDLTALLWMQGIPRRDWVEV